MNIEQIRTTYNYPPTTPPNSTYLVLNERRCFISVIELAFSEIIKFSKSSPENFPQGTFFSKLISSDILRTVEVGSRGLFFDQKICNDKEKLNEAYKSLCAGIKEIKLEEKNDPTSLYHSISSVGRRIFEEQLNKLGIRTIASDCHLNSDDFKLVKADEALYQQNQRSMECQDFAFYHLHEEKAFPFVFNSKKSSWPLDFALAPKEFMPSWGYQQVQTPQPGDLVIYYSTLKGFRQTKHWGILNDKNHVISKWGDHPAFEHSLEDVAMAYGNYVHFFRKKHRFALQKRILDELQIARQGLMDFKHPATSAPMTAIGTLNYFNTLFKEEFKLQAESALKGSVFGRRALETYGKKVLSRMESFIVTNIHDKASILEQIEEIINKEADQTPLHFI